MSLHVIIDGYNLIRQSHVFSVLDRQNLQDDVEIKLSGCHGFCEKGPIMVLHPEGIFYPQIKGEHIPDIVERTIKNGEVVDSLLFKDLSTKKKIVMTFSA